GGRAGRGRAAGGLLWPAASGQSRLRATARRCVSSRNRRTRARRARSRGRLATSAGTREPCPQPFSVPSARRDACGLSRAVQAVDISSTLPRRQIIRALRSYSLRARSNRLCFGTRLVIGAPTLTEHTGPHAPSR